MTLRRTPCADIAGSNPANNLCGILKPLSQPCFSNMDFNKRENLKSNLEEEEEIWWHAASHVSHTTPFSGRFYSTQKTYYEEPRFLFWHCSLLCIYRREHK